MSDVTVDATISSILHRIIDVIAHWLTKKYLKYILGLELKLIDTITRNFYQTNWSYIKIQNISLKQHVLHIALKNDYTNQCLKTKFRNTRIIGYKLRNIS